MRGGRKRRVFFEPKSVANRSLTCLPATFFSKSSRLIASVTPAALRVLRHPILPVLRESSEELGNTANLWLSFSFSLANIDQLNPLCKLEIKMKRSKRLSDDPSPHIPPPNASPKERKKLRNEEGMKSTKRQSNVPSPHIQTPNISPKKRKEKLHEEEDYQLIWETIYEDQVREATPKEESDNERARKSSNSDNSDWEFDNQYDKPDEKMSNKTIDSEWSFGINADEETRKDSPKTEAKDTNCHSSIANCALDHEDELFGDPEIFDPYIIQDSPTTKNSRQIISTPERLKLKAPDDKAMCTPTAGFPYRDFLGSPISWTNDNFPDFASNNNDDAKEYLRD
ncbi:hypothetical protein Ddc_03045 [Ditylenchus destructor]|nr:hypothetical protein Ddc_03045 [Ditylenchus destructor]